MGLALGGVDSTAKGFSFVDFLCIGPLLQSKRDFASRLSCAGCDPMINPLSIHVQDASQF
jgi:hypothetical protein